MTAMIGICLATFNGARFLSEQLDSIAAQSFTDWHLYVRDDGSTDGTVEILADFAFRHPAQVTILKDDLGQLGAKMNFAHLMGVATEPYVAFSDQDDVWRPDKLEISLAEIRSVERRRARGVPALVHGDRRVIDADGAEIAPSYWASRGIAPGEFEPFSGHLGFCLAAGAAMLVNRPLLKMALPLPDAARMHDTWLELVAHAFGGVEAMSDVVLDYRRHDANVSGGRSDNTSGAARRPWARALRLWRGWEVQRQTTTKYLRQASAFRDAHGADLAPDFARRLDIFLGLPGNRLPGRIISLWRARACPPGISRGLVFAMLARKTQPQAAGYVREPEISVASAPSVSNAA